jgi:hypothetical protein
MPSVKIELGEQKQAIEAGIHLAKITDAVEAISKAGNDMLKLEVAVGPLKFNSWVVFTTKNSRNLADFAEAIGLKVVDGKPLAIEIDDCIGKTAKVELGPGEKISEKTGKPYLEIRRWLPIDATDLSVDEIPF